MNAVTTIIQPELRPIPGFDGVYSVTSDGRVWIHPRTWSTGAGGKICRHHSGMWARLHTNRRYITFNASINGKKFSLLVHRAVALAWIPNPKGLPQVNHKSADRQENHTANLEWVTASGNTQHFHDSGRWSPTEAFLASVRRNAVVARAAKAQKAARA